MTRGRPAIVFSEKIIPLLGRMPDSQVARLAKCSPPTIKAYRVKNNIPAYSNEDDVVAAATAIAAVIPPTEEAADTTTPRSAQKEEHLVTVLAGLRNATKHPDGWLLSATAYADLLNSVLRLYYDEV